MKTIRWIFDQITRISESLWFGIYAWGSTIVFLSSGTNLSFSQRFLGFAALGFFSSGIVLAVQRSALSLISEILEGKKD